MSRIREVLAKKKEIDKQRSQERKEKLETIKLEAIYKAKLLEEMQVISDLFDNDLELESVIIEIPEKNLTMFTRLMYTDLEDFQIRQKSNKANVFEVKRKIISF